MTRPPVKLTDYEIEALSGKFNFADGHARFSFAPSGAILSELGHQFASPISQEEAESEFASAFFSIAKQTSSAAVGRALYCPSASISIDIAANYLRSNRLSVALVEPTFDNLADILKRHGVVMEALSEELLRTDGIGACLDRVTADAIFVVTPNNPTGFCFGESDFRALVQFCVSTQKLLLLDFSFRFFSQEMLAWDQYALLEESGVRYIVVEDTGKTWPTFELKVGPLLADSATFPHVSSIYRDFFMCHSPVILSLVANVIQATREQGLERSILIVPQTNRLALHSALAGSPLAPVSSPTMSVEWIRIETALDDWEVVHRLKNLGIYILPGRNFYWHSPQHGSRFVRFALMRDIDMFASGMRLMSSVLPDVLHVD